MRLGLMVGYSGSQISLPMEMIKEADCLGYYAVWTAEAYGSDAVTPLAWIGAQTERIKLGTAILSTAAQLDLSGDQIVDVALGAYDPFDTTSIGAVYVFLAPGL